MTDENRISSRNSGEFDQLVRKIGDRNCEFFPPSTEKAGVGGGESPERDSERSTAEDPVRTG
ncbi:unnamed protein product [marine sediment metagenome]|uniref:Uncharacterized protein n=1 Tax=marine sediment metagenome TaxID=412755 RepID=X1DP70_9ZZZZ